MEKVKQGSVIRAYKVISKLNENPLPLKTAHAFFLVKKELVPHFEFQSDKEKEIYDKYSPVPTENGGLDFGSAEKAQEFTKEFNKLIDEMQELEVDIDFIKPEVRLEDDIKLTIEDVEALEPFVNFV